MFSSVPVDAFPQNTQVMDYEIFRKMFMFQPGRTMRFTPEIRDKSSKLFVGDQEWGCMKKRYPAKEKKVPETEAKPRKTLDFGMKNQKLQLRSKKVPSCDVRALMKDLTDTIAFNRKKSQPSQEESEQSQSNRVNKLPIKRSHNGTLELLQNVRKTTISKNIFKLPNLEPKSKESTPQIEDQNKVSASNAPTETSNQPSSSKTSIKKMEPTKLFLKGYMGYDPDAREFYDKNIANISERALLEKLTISVSANSYLVMDSNSMKTIAAKNIEQKIEIASLTKVMTAYLTLLICKKYEVDPESEKVRISDRAAEMPGTSAQLEAGDILTVHQLLYGLMLPSGNDASVALAETMGKIIQRNKKKETKKTYYEIFILHMNLLSKELGLDQEWGNSSGLSKNPNLSTPKAISVLSALAIRNRTLAEVVSTKLYEIEIKNERYGLSRKQTWKNTNKLLDKDWKGVKTGTTDSAGHCLMALRDSYLISVYDCESLAKRFSQCSKIYERVNTHLQQTCQT